MCAERSAPRGAGRAGRGAGSPRCICRHTSYMQMGGRDGCPDIPHKLTQPCHETCGPDTPRVPSVRSPPAFCTKSPNAPRVYIFNMGAKSPRSHREPRAYFEGKSWPRSTQRITAELGLEPGLQTRDWGSHVALGMSWGHKALSPFTLGHGSYLSRPLSFSISTPSPPCLSLSPESLSATPFLP